MHLRDVRFHHSEKPSAGRNDAAISDMAQAAICRIWKPDLATINADITVVDEQNRAMFDTGAAVVKTYARDIMRAIGIDVPRTAAQQARTGARIARDTAHLEPGDLLVFGSDTLIEHVGIYIGDGRFIHASSVAGRVIESPIRRPPDPLIKPWVAARRLSRSRN